MLCHGVCTLRLWAKDGYAGHQTQAGCKRLKMQLDGLLDVHTTVMLTIIGKDDEAVTPRYDLLVVWV